MLKIEEKNRTFSLNHCLPPHAQTSVIMCDKHQRVEWSCDMIYDHTPLSEVCYTGCLSCIQDHLDTVRSDDKEIEAKRKAFAIECVAWGKSTYDLSDFCNREDERQDRLLDLANRERCLLFFVNIGWKDTTGCVFEHMGHNLSFSCAIKLCETGSWLHDTEMLNYIKIGSSQQIRLLTLYSDNELGLLWHVGYKRCGRDIANELVKYLGRNY